MTACPDPMRPSRCAPHGVQSLVLPDEFNELLNPEAELQAALRAKTRQRFSWWHCGALLPGQPDQLDAVHTAPRAGLPSTPTAIHSPRLQGLWFRAQPPLVQPQQSVVGAALLPMAQTLRDSWVDPTGVTKVRSCQGHHKAAGPPAVQSVGDTMSWVKQVPTWGQLPLCTESFS